MGNICKNISKDSPHIPLDPEVHEKDYSDSVFTEDESMASMNTAGKNPFHVYKIVLVGAERVGKTCWLEFYESRQFRDKYVPTSDLSFSNHQMQVKVDRKEYEKDQQLSRVSMEGYRGESGGTPLSEEVMKQQIKETIFFQLWDGCKAEPSVYFDDVDAVILMFDVSDESSFLELKKTWLDELEENIENFAKVPFIIVGNKVDSKTRAISYKQGNKFSDQSGAEFYFETSCKTGQNVDVALNRLVQRIHDMKRG